MRSRLAVLMLLAVLPLMSVLAAPVPEPYAILDIGPAPKGWSAEKHREMEIGHLTNPDGVLLHASLDPEVKKLKSVTSQKFPSEWMSKNFRVVPDEGSRLRLTFQAGDRTEQAAILNTLLRTYLRPYGEKRQRLEKNLRYMEAGVPELIKVIESGENPRQEECNRKELERLQANIPGRRAEIARLKQITVIRWAK